MKFHSRSDHQFSLVDSPIPPKSLMEQDTEKRIRRKIANSNERRRMQSINAGFQSLRALLPHSEGEKLSKAAILQSTADYVYQLEQEKTRLMEQISQSRRMSQSPSHMQESDGSCSGSPLPKRKKREPVDSIDEGIGCSSPPRSENGAEDLKREIIELRLQLEHERALRLLVETRLLNLESRIFSADGTHDSADQIQLDYHTVAEEIEKCSMNFGQESGHGSPLSQTSGQNIESSHELSLRGSSPQLSDLHVPMNLSGKNNSLLLPSVDKLSVSDTSMESFPVDYNITAQARQNLETIVEAIRHVEGDHMFRDDLAPVKSLNSVDQNIVLIIEQDQCEEQTEQQIFSVEGQEVSSQHEIIRSVPLVQSRPGVIVSNLS